MSTLQFLTFFFRRIVTLSDDIFHIKVLLNMFSHQKGDFFIAFYGDFAFYITLTYQLTITINKNARIFKTLQKQLIFTFRLQLHWRMYGTCIPTQKFDSIIISVARDIRKIWQKSPIWKLSRLFILHSYTAEKLSTNRLKR